MIYDIQQWNIKNETKDFYSLFSTRKPLFFGQINILRDMQPINQDIFGGTQLYVEEENVIGQGFVTTYIGPNENLISKTS